MVFQKHAEAMTKMKCCIGAVCVDAQSEDDSPVIACKGEHCDVAVHPGMDVRLGNSVI